MHDSECIGIFMKKTNTFYITTPIYYVTAKPHLGSLYSTLLADVLGRWHHINGADIFFLTGTDEHGQKIQHAAMQARKDPQVFVDDFIPAYKDAWHLYEIAFSKFMRTTSTEHRKGVQYFIQKLMDKGDIYKDFYNGWYCTPCETFVTERDQENLAEGPLCPSCRRATVRIEEETYFFKLSGYQNKLLQFYADNPHFIVPQERSHEVLSFIKSGLKDLSISRTTVSWGVPFPHSTEHTIYVWVEALCNYITAIGYGDTQRVDEFEKWWPANIHILGKDIIKFHGVFWPALLMAANVPLPKQLLVHGWIKVDKQKMSKSLGNVIDPITLAQTYGVDQVRYYLCRQMPINQDGDFSIKDLEERIVSDLAHDLGNLLNRILKLAEKYEAIGVQAPALWDHEVLELRDYTWNTIEQFSEHMNAMHIHLALGALWKCIHKINAYFHTKEPWKQAKQSKESFLMTMSAACHGLRTIAILCWPVMPSKMTELLMALGIRYIPSEKTIQDLNLDVWNHYFEFKHRAPLFDISSIEERKIQEEIMNNQSLKQEYKHMELTTSQQAHIDIKDLIKVELVIGTIIVCDEVKGSSKLYRLEVDCGKYGIRQILSGVRSSFQPGDLIGKQATFVLNLEPRVMMGFESRGMMLVAENEAGKVELIMPEHVVLNGSRLR